MLNITTFLDANSKRLDKNVLYNPTTGKKYNSKFWRPGKTGNPQATSKCCQNVCLFIADFRAKALTRRVRYRLILVCDYVPALGF